MAPLFPVPGQRHRHAESSGAFVSAAPQLHKLSPALPQHLQYPATAGSCADTGWRLVFGNYWLQFSCYGAHCAFPSCRISDLVFARPPLPFSRDGHVTHAPVWGIMWRDWLTEPPDCLTIEHFATSIPYVIARDHKNIFWLRSITHQYSSLPTYSSVGRPIFQSADSP